MNILVALTASICHMYPWSHRVAVFLNVSIIAQCISVHKGILDTVFINVTVIAQFIHVQGCILNCTVYQCLVNVSLISVQECIHKCTVYQCSWMYPKSQYISVHIICHFHVWCSMSNKFYVNYCLYLKFENFFQIRYIFIAGSCHHTRKVKDVTKVYVLTCWCTFWSEVAADPKLYGQW